MDIKNIHMDERKHVKAVFLHGDLLYTVTYILDDEGFVEKMIRVYADGDVEVQ